MAEADRQGPLYQRVKSELRETIARGDYVSDEPFISEREVRERFGVSTTTAVRALNELVAEGVLIRRRGAGTFVAERAAPVPGEPAGEGPLVAYVGHLFGAHSSRLLSGVASAAGELGYRMSMIDTKGSVQEQEQALRTALAQGADGVLLCPVDDRARSAALADLRRHDVQMVMVDRYRPDLPTDAVVADNFAIGYRLTEHLITAGHRRIAMLWGETDCTSVRDRLVGHQRALLDHGLPVPAELSALTSYQDLPDEQRLAALQRLLDLPEPPTALLAANAYVLAAATRDLIELGVRLPDQVEPASMDDAGPFDLLPLTPVAAVLPSERMGERAMRLLAERIADPSGRHRKEHIVLPIEIRTRESASGNLRVISAL